MADIFSTDVLNAVVADLKTPSSFMLDSFFPNEQRPNEGAVASAGTESAEYIHFDIDYGKRRMSPFVSPLVEGKVVQSRGYATKTFKPAYVKDKRVWDGNRAFKRVIGEQIGGAMTAIDRMRATLAFELTDQLNMITRRLEWMAAQVMMAGKVTVVGDNYPSVLVDFGRSAAQTVVLTGGARWGQAGVSPLDLLQDWALIVLQQSGSMPVNVVMDVGAWKVFRADATVNSRLTLQRSLGQMPTMAQSAQITQGGTFMGSLDGFNFWVYSDWYVDDVTGTETPMLPTGTVLLGGNVQGVRAYGAIRDEDAGYRALPYFTKSWVTQDPSVRYLLMQSAPLVVPYRVDATFCATVL